MIKCLFALAITVLAFSSCKKITPVNVNNKPPQAEAGPDQNIFLSNVPVRLDGSLSSDYEKDSLNYFWYVVAAPGTTQFSSSNAAQVQVSLNVVGAYQFALRVTDSHGASDEDTVSVFVSQNNIPTPVIDSFYYGNVFFYCPDPTGTMPTPDAEGYISPWIYWTDHFDNLLPLIYIQVDSLNNILAGIWSGDGRKPRCPVINDYNCEPGNTASFKLPPGTYTWSAKNSTDAQQFSFATNAFYKYFASLHQVSGTITVNSADDCIVVPIIF